MRGMNLSLKLFILAFILILFKMNIYSRIWLNGAGTGYEEGSSAESTAGVNITTIENYIIDGAGYYLEVNLNVQILLKMVELKDRRGIDYDRMLKTMDIAIANMENALDTYAGLIAKAEVTPYNTIVTGKLRDFDYPGFMREKGLNSVVFSVVAEYLKKGDITGTFKETFARLQFIFDMLNKIRDEISLYKLPDVPVFLELNETFSRASLFGSYVARVFAGISREK